MNTKKPPMTQAEKNGGRYAAEVAAAKRDGWEGRSAALTAWQKGEGIMVRKDVLEDVADCVFYDPDCTRCMGENEIDDGHDEDCRYEKFAALVRVI